MPYSHTIAKSLDHHGIKNGEDISIKIYLSTYLCCVEIFCQHTDLLRIPQLVSPSLRYASKKLLAIIHTTYSCCPSFFFFTNAILRWTAWEKIVSKVS